MVKDLYRPGHANFTYLKTCIFDYRGGRLQEKRPLASQLVLLQKGSNRFRSNAPDLYGNWRHFSSTSVSDLHMLRSKTRSSPIFCPDEKSAELMMEKIAKAKEENDSLVHLGLCCSCTRAGLGDPVYGSLKRCSLLRCSLCRLVKALRSARDLLARMRREPVLITIRLMSIARVRCIWRAILEEHAGHISRHVLL